MLLLSRQRKAQGLPGWRNWKAVPVEELLQERWGQQWRGGPSRATAWGVAVFTRDATSSGERKLLMKKSL